MSESTARTLRLVKAAGMREAAEALMGDRYENPSTKFELDHNNGMESAASLVIDLALELENQL